jgi:lipoteichoic acid synthase
MNHKRYFEIIWLPTALTILLIVETLLFNFWLGFPGFYLWRCVAATIGLSMLLFFPTIFFAKENTRYVFLFLISLIITLIFVSQFLYYKYAGTFLPISSLSYAGLAIYLTGIIKTLLTYKLLFFLLPLILIIASYFLVGKNQNKILFSKKKKFAVFCSMLVVFCGSYGSILVLEKHDFGDLSRLHDNQKMQEFSTLVGKVGIINFCIENLADLTLRPSLQAYESKNFLASWAKKRPAPVQSSNFGILKNKNLIFIQVESLENWTIDYKIKGIEVAPNLTRLSKQGKYFTNYYSQIAHGNTADAEFSILNSLYPLPDSVAFVTKTKNDYYALPKLLGENGYTTVSMHGDVNTFWNRSEIYPLFGYGQQISQRSCLAGDIARQEAPADVQNPCGDYKIMRSVGFGDLGDADFFEQSLPKLKSLKEPFMVTLITLSMHTPFILPADLETLVMPKDTNLTETQQQYLQAVHYTDQALGKFIDNLKTNGLYDRSLILIYGDHGAYIGTPDSENQHVPLIMLASDRSIRGIDETPASHLDLYPTVTNLLGIHYPATVIGQDIFNTTKPVVTQRQMGTGTIKSILSPNLKYNDSCTTLPELKPLPTTYCKELYDQQMDETKASDAIVRYNLLPALLNLSK